MRRVLVAAILLSTAMSDKNPTKDRQEASYRLTGKQFWSRRGKRVPRDTIRIDIDDFLGTSVFTKAIKLPSPGPTRHADINSKHLQNNPSQPSSEDIKSRIVAPMLLLSVDFRDLLDETTQFPSRCNSDNCHFQEDGWKLQKPMYVDEPSWIEIESDYTDHVPHYMDSADPFVLSRGKKIQIFKSTIDAPTEESSKGYQGFKNIQKMIPSPTMNSLTRSKRSMRLNKYERKRNDGKNTDVEKKDDDNESVKTTKEKSYTADLENYEDPFVLSRGKKMHTENDEYRLKFEGEDNSGYYPDDRYGTWFFAVNKDRRFKRSLPSFDFKQENIDEDNFNDSTKEPRELLIRANSNKESLISQIVNEVLHNQSDNVAIIKKRLFGHNKFDKMDLPSFYMQLKKRDKLKDNYDATSTNWKEEHPFERQDDEQIGGEYNSWYKNIPKTNSDERYEQERVKHSDIFKILEQPYIISRGKKDNGQHNAEISLNEEQNEYDGLANTLVLKEILKKLTESLRSISEEYVDNRNKIVKKKRPRDRRGVLDDLLAKYDPYYVARGKRISVNNSLAKIRGVSKSEMNFNNSFRTGDKTDAKGEVLM